MTQRGNGPHGTETIALAFVKPLYEFLESTAELVRLRCTVEDVLIFLRPRGIHFHNAPLSACTSGGGLSTAGFCFVFLIVGLWVCGSGAIFTTLWRFAER